MKETTGNNKPFKARLDRINLVHNPVSLQRPTSFQSFLLQKREPSSRYNLLEKPIEKWMYNKANAWKFYIWRCSLCPLCSFYNMNGLKRLSLQMAVTLICKLGQLIDSLFSPCTALVANKWIACYLCFVWGTWTYTRGIAGVCGTGPRWGDMVPL